ncbi:DUF4179 domain-containing protein [Bacillus sp. ISL-55]|uniref:DUF4179 domain-containing protein n=1 Tax=Bacillus sp. ISL-55 TaxID=2819134 RepID=UPI001BEA2824|nr:DUF4179 domain-containing protein [Bacillus sp. ISL-55]MBT2693021.1 DUF4179 domain-containing protein [Bacillus sp. ISL-55]
MSMKEWMEMDIDQLELLEVTDIEKARVKHNVLKKRRKAPIWRNIAVAAVIIVGASTATSFAFPSFASQIPFMDNVISFLNGAERDYKDFETFSSDIGLAQTSNGITVMIDNAVYDGTNVTVSFAIESDYNFDGHLDVRAPNWFYVREATGGSGGGFKFTKISDNRYVGITTFTPAFKDDQPPERIEVTWEPGSFYSQSNDLEVKGDWSFAFSLNRVKGDIQIVNQTVQKEDVSFTLHSVEFTDISTVIRYEQEVPDVLLEEWVSVTPVFQVTDNLGNVYMDGTSGPGETTDDYKTFKGTSNFGTIKEGASKLFIQPIQIASLTSGKGHKKIELQPIVIDLKKYE